jgi:anti-anti-sigma factor
MKHLPQTVSEDMYHRVYRLMKRDIDSRLIAAALSLPLRTVLNVIARLKKNEAMDSGTGQSVSLHKKVSNRQLFLDIYFLAKTRYALLQLVGYLVKEQAETLELELQKVQSSVWKAVAVKMSDVAAMDETGARLLLRFCESLRQRERFVAILDPSPEIEQSITRYGFEEKIPIFGTEHAFEEKAFLRKTVSSQRTRNR